MKVHKPIGSKERFLEMFQGVNKMKLNEAYRDDQTEGNSGTFSVDKTGDDMDVVFGPENKMFGRHFVTFSTPDSQWNMDAIVSPEEYQKFLAGEQIRVTAVDKGNKTGMNGTLSMRGGSMGMNLNEDILTRGEGSGNIDKEAFDELVQGNLNIEQTNTQASNGENYIEIVGADDAGNVATFKFLVTTTPGDQDGVATVDSAKLIQLNIKGHGFNTESGEGVNTIVDLNNQRGQDMIEVVSEYVDTNDDMPDISEEMYEEAVKFIDKVPYKKGTEQIQTNKAYADQKPTNDALRVNSNQLDKFVSESDLEASGDLELPPDFKMPNVPNDADDGTKGIDPLDEPIDFDVNEPVEAVSPEKAALINQAYESLTAAGNQAPTIEDILREVDKLGGVTKTVEKTRAIPKGAEEFYEGKSAVDDINADDVVAHGYNQLLPEEQKIAIIKMADEMLSERLGVKKFQMPKEDYIRMVKGFALEIYHRGAAQMNEEGENEGMLDVNKDIDMIIGQLVTATSEEHLLNMLYDVADEYVPDNEKEDPARYNQVFDHTKRMIISKFIKDENVRNAFSNFIPYMKKEYSNTSGSMNEETEKSPYPDQMGKKFKPKNQMPKKKKRPQAVVKLTEEDAEVPSGWGAKKYAKADMKQDSDMGKEVPYDAEFKAQTPEADPTASVDDNPAPYERTSYSDIPEPYPFDSRLHEKGDEPKDDPVSPEKVGPEWTEKKSGEETGNQVPGGKADDKDPVDFNAQQIMIGMGVEMEHTDDPKVALEITMDHLMEIPDYYTRLGKMEKEAGVEPQDEGLVDSTPEEEETTDELLGFKPHNVGDYTNEAYGEPDADMEREKQAMQADIDNAPIPDENEPVWNVMTGSGGAINVAHDKEVPEYKRGGKMIHQSGLDRREAFQIADEMGAERAGDAQSGADAEYFDRAGDPMYEEEVDLGDYQGEIGDRYEDGKGNQLTVKDEIEGGVTLQSQDGDKEIVTQDIQYLKPLSEEDSSQNYSVVEKTKHGMTYVFAYPDISGVDTEEGLNDWERQDSANREIHFVDSREAAVGGLESFQESKKLETVDEMFGINEEQVKLARQALNKRGLNEGMTKKEAVQILIKHNIR